MQIFRLLLPCSADHLHRSENQIVRRKRSSFDLFSTRKKWHPKSTEY